MSGNEAAQDPRQAEATLSMISGRLHVRLNGAEKAVPATIVYLRPLSARSEIAFFNEDAEEILLLNSLDQLAPDSRAIAAEKLAERYHLPEITRVLSIETRFGTHYWRVETDKGPCAFAFKEPGKNVTQLGEEQIILRDTIGNRYEIRSLRQLDSHSRRQINKIL